MTGLFLMGFNFLFAQKVLQPDFHNVPAYYIEGSNELHNLEKENINIVVKMGKMVYELQGLESKVRIKQTDNYILIIKAGEIDPSTVMQLKKMTLTKKNRQATITQMQGLFNVATSTGNLAYTLKKLDDNVYSIIPESKLEPGE